MLEKTIILDGFSKTYAMTGWRMGYGVMPRMAGRSGHQADGQFQLLHRQLHAARRPRRARRPAGAVDAMVAEFRRRRDAFCAALNQVPGFRCAIPGGAFYAFANITGTGMKSKELADHLLYEAGVACLNGAAFGEYGEGYIRFSYANSSRI